MTAQERFGKVAAANHDEVAHPLNTRLKELWERVNAYGQNNDAVDGRRFSCFHWRDPSISSLRRTVSTASVGSGFSPTGPLPVTIGSPCSAARFPPRRCAAWVEQHVARVERLLENIPKAPQGANLVDGDPIPF